MDNNHPFRPEPCHKCLEREIMQNRVSKKDDVFTKLTAISIVAILTFLMIAVAFSVEPKGKHLAEKDCFWIQNNGTYVSIILAQHYDSGEVHGHELINIEPVHLQTPSTARRYAYTHELPLCNSQKDGYNQ